MHCDDNRKGTEPKGKLLREDFFLVNIYFSVNFKLRKRDKPGGVGVRDLQVEGKTKTIFNSRVSTVCAQRFKSYSINEP